MTDELPLEQSEKYTTEKLLLGFDFAEDVARGITVSAIVSITATTMGNVVGSVNGDITISGQSYAKRRVQAFFAGGTAGETYILACKANFTDGQAPLERRGKLYIKTV